MRAGSREPPPRVLRAAQEQRRSGTQRWAGSSWAGITASTARPRGGVGVCGDAAVTLKAMLPRAWKRNEPQRAAVLQVNHSELEMLGSFSST